MRGAGDTADTADTWREARACSTRAWETAAATEARKVCEKRVLSRGTEVAAATVGSRARTSGAWTEAVAVAVEASEEAEAEAEETVGVVEVEEVAEQTWERSRWSRCWPEEKVRRRGTE